MCDICSLGLSYMVLSKVHETVDWQLLVYL